MSENIKLRFDPNQGKVGISADVPATAEAAQLDDTEAQMRRALGLHDEAPRHRIDTDRTDMPQRPMERYTPGGGHRRRFVQDGDVPVTIVRRDGGADPAASRPATLSTPSSSRLQRIESALAAETAARDRAERALAEAQAAIRDLQTKIGHADLAKNEAVEAARREREASIALRTAADDHTRQLAEADQRAETAEQALSNLQTTLTTERAARKATERTLAETTAAKEATEQLLKDLAAEPVPVVVSPEQPARRRVASRPEPRRTKPAVVQHEADPEPVKWWLTSKPTGKRR